MTTTEQYLSAKDVARLLGISRATFYRIPFFRRRKVKVSERAIRYAASDVARYLGKAA